MIVISKLPFCADAFHDRFLQMLPAIHEEASVAFRGEKPELKEELTAEVVANTYAAFVRLVERDKEHLAYATPLAHYAIRQVRVGRRVGTKLKVRDALSPANRSITVERLDRFDRETREWKEALVEDKHAGPADTAAARIDLAAWLSGLNRTKRQVARKLARGETTGAVARMCGLSAGRVSQLRRELAESWDSFQGESAAAA